MAREMETSGLPKFSDKEICEAEEALDRIRDKWLARPGVSAVDIGYKIKTSKRRVLGVLCLRAHVAEKLPMGAVSDPIPGGVLGFPTDVIQARYGVRPPDDVIQARYGVRPPDDQRRRRPRPLPPRSHPMEEPQVGEDLRPEADRVKRHDPLIGGISVGSDAGSGGTLGAIVWMEAADGSEEAFILSNWHVLCSGSDAQVGDKVLQPSLDDERHDDDRNLAALIHDWRIDEGMDAAIARIGGLRESENRILDLDRAGGGADEDWGNGTIPPRLGMKVMKSGVATKVTEGVIDGIGHSTEEIWFADGSVVAFRDQIHIVPLPPWSEEDYEVSDNGDSGSVWFDSESGKAVGLNFLGEADPAPRREHAVACPMMHVAEKLGFRFMKPEPLPVSGLGSSTN